MVTKCNALCQLAGRLAPVRENNTAVAATAFYGDEFVQSLIGRVPTVDLADLMGVMKALAVASPDEYSTPIVLLD